MPVRIENSINSVKVIFDLKRRDISSTNVLVNVPVNLGITQKKVLELIRKNHNITHSEIADKLSISEKTAKRTTLTLRELGLIKRFGSDKSGHWEIL